jgi:hypothetical protein
MISLRSVIASEQLSAIVGLGHQDPTPADSDFHPDGFI